MRIHLLTTLLASSLVLSTAPAQEPDAAVPADGFPPAVLENTSAMDASVVELLTELADDVRSEPTSGEKHASLGLAYEANTMWSLAEVEYGHAIALMPDRPEWLYRRGLMRNNNGDIEGAEADLGAAAGQLRGTAVIQARHGDVLRLLGRLEEARAAWERAIESESRLEGDVKFPQSRVGLAQVMLDLEDFERAEALAAEALALAPGYKHAHYTRGLALRELGRDDEARDELRRGLQAFPEFPPDPHWQRLAEYGRGYNRRMMQIENQLQAGDVPGATAALDALLTERGEDPYVLNLAARAATMRGDGAAAQALLDRSLAANDALANTYTEYTILLLNRLAALQQRVAQLTQLGADASEPQAELDALDAEAREKAQRALELAPRQGRGYYYAGMIQMQTAGQDREKLQAAMQSFNAALRFGCTEPRFYANLAQLHAMTGDVRQMVRYAELSDARMPGDISVLMMLMQGYANSGRPAECAGVADRLVVAAPRDPAVLQQSIRGYLTAGALDPAERAVDVLAEVGASSPEVMQFVQAVRQHITTQRQAPPPPAGGGGGR